MAYDERFVAFLDILGFKNIIKATADNPDEYERVRSALEYIAEIKTDHYEGEFARLRKEHGIPKEVPKEVSVFSDSIVISYNSGFSIGGALFHMLIDLVHISLNLLDANILVRGGVAYGQMHHDKHVCFGPAMIKAYQLEKKSAVYPRIVVDIEAIRVGLALPGMSHTPKMEAEYLCNILCEDRTGVVFLDFLYLYEEFSTNEGYIEYMCKIKSYIEDHLAKGYCPKIRKKYVWFAKYYNRTAKAMGLAKNLGLIKLPSGRPYYGSFIKHRII